MNPTPQELSRRFPSFEKELLEEMAAAGEIRTFREGEVLLRTGQNIRSTMLILDGLAKIYREDEEGAEFFMYYLDAGKPCVLSLVCALKQEQSELMAKAVTDLKVLTVPLSRMDEWMTKYKSWGQFVLGTYRERFEELLHTIDHIAFRNMDERLLYYLRRHQETLKTNIISLSITEIAQELNSSREVISRLLKKLSEKGVVRLHRSHIEILDLGALPA
jgi:CRP/FNR family transcriptional regulator, anaerobic regulatory protein